VVHERETDLRLAAVGSEKYVSTDLFLLSFYWLNLIQEKQSIVKSENLCIIILLTRVI